MTQNPERTDEASKGALTPLLSKSLASPDFQQHRAMVAIELEVMAKKMDRFGWERDRNTAAHDRLVMDWITALQDYTLVEVQAACRAHVLDKPDAMPTEGHIVKRILAARAEALRRLPQPLEPKRADEGPPRGSEERAALAAAMIRDAGFRMNEFGGVEG